MRTFQISVISGVALVTLMSFQNCSKKSFDGAPVDSSSTTPANTAASVPVASNGGSSVTTPAVSVSGSSISNTSGQIITFNANDGTPLGSVTKVSSGSGFTLLKLYNGLSGRINQVYVISDPSSGAFLRVIAATAQPFMCHDPMAPPCANGYTNVGSGQSEMNCNSPILFSGSLSGSVNNLAGSGAYTYYNCTN